MVLPPPCRSEAAVPSGSHLPSPFFALRMRRTVCGRPDGRPTAAVMSSGTVVTKRAKGGRTERPPCSPSSAPRYCAGPAGCYRESRMASPAQSFRNPLHRRHPTKARFSGSNAASKIQDPAMQHRRPARTLESVPASRPLPPAQGRHPLRICRGPATSEFSCARGDQFPPAMAR